MEKEQTSLMLSGDGIFFTEQGEGPTMGEPAVFVRLNECNLDCSFCDTPYTWKKSDPSYKERKKQTVEQVCEDIIAASQDAKRIVITGGEPLLQQTAIAELCGAPQIKDWTFEIETNGTIEPSALRHVGKLQINCSPKLSNSNVDRDKRIRPSVIQVLAGNYNSYFKFVVGKRDDLQEIENDFLSLVPELDRGRIYISPLGSTVEAIDSVRNEIFQDVARLGYALGDRRQIRMHGNTRRR